MRQNIGFSAFIIAMVIAYRGAVPGPQPSGPPAGTPKGQSEADQNKKPGDLELEGPWWATRAFFHFEESPKAPLLQVTAERPDGSVDFTNPSSVGDCVAAALSCRPQLVHYFGIPAENRNRVQFVIATVPDPLHSRLSLFTDSEIEAIEDAAQESGWLFANEWLPWIDSANPEEKDPEKRREEREAVRLQEKQPGILVFRSHATGGVYPGDVLVIFLVGETPTAGVNPQQFQLARAYMRTIQEPNNVRVMGPTFSGSFYSLDRLLKDDRKHGSVTEYLVRSGTATGITEGCAFAGSENVDFRSATADSYDQGRYFKAVFESLRIQAKQAALLVEDESAFGVAAANASTQLPGPDGCQVSEESKAEGIRVFRFPREISHLRNAYKDAVAASKSGASPPQEIQFSVKDPETGEDSIPIFSGAQSPLSQNGVVNDIANAIRREDIRLVWVEATNVLDVLFLANVLRRQCPDTRLLLSHADVLLIQATQSEPLTGTLVLASYPMFYESNHWMGGMQQNEPVTFPDANSEGVYNATVLLLNEDHEASKHLADYYWHDLPHPPTWLLTLDHQGFLPVNVFPHSKAEEQHETWFQQGHRPAEAGQPPLSRPPKIWNVAATSVALLGLGLAMWVWWISCNPTSERDARFSWQKIDEESGWRQFYVVSLLLAIFCMEGLIAIPAWRLEPPARFLALLTVSAIVVLLVSGLVGKALPSQRGKWAAGLIALGVAAFFILWLRSCLHPGDRSLFFDFRARELRFGSSPVWPLVSSLSALALFQFVQLTRSYFAACQKPEVVTDGIQMAMSERLQEGWVSFNRALESSFGLGLANRIRDAFQSSAAPQTRLVTRVWLTVKTLASEPSCLPPALLVAGFVVGALFHISAQMRFIDDRPYNLLVLTLHLVVIGSLLLTCVYIRLLWHSLQTILASLGALPIARSFQPVDRFQADRPIWVRRLNLQSIDIHIQSLYVLHNMTLLTVDSLLLRPALIKYLPQLNAKYDKYRGYVEELLRLNPGRSRSETLVWTTKMRVVNMELAKSSLEFLLSYWAKNALVGPELPEKASSEDKPAAEPKAGKALDQLAGMAERFVALHYSSFILYAVRQIQNLLIFVSSGFVLLIISLNCYSIQAPQFVGRLLLILFLIIGTVTVSCLVGLEKDPVLSRMSGSDPGKLNLDFYFKIAGYGALPALSMVASVFPSVSNFLLSWVEPTLEAFK